MSFSSLMHAENEGFWNLWFSELRRGQVGMTYKIKNILHSGQTRFQRIDVLDTFEYGKMLVLYGSVMITEKDEFIYHEMLAHVPAVAHGSAGSALVIGGGDGLTVRELLKHPGIGSITLVDIDEQVIETCRKFFPDSEKAFSDPRVKVEFGDGAQYVKDAAETWDLILVDAADPVPPADVLFKREFYEACRSKLNPGGILAAQTESPFYNPDVFSKVYADLSEIFTVTKPYLAWIPTYPSALWSFAFCSDSVHPIDSLPAVGPDEVILSTQWYNLDVHRASFALPNFVRTLL